MSKKSGKPAVTSRRRFFRQFLASAIESVEDVGRSLQDARREIESQRQAWSMPHYDPAPWQPPDSYGPPWPPPYGPPIPLKVRHQLRETQRYYYGGTVARDPMD